MTKAALVATFVLAIFGVFVGGLMTWHHDTQLYGDQQGELIGCVESAAVNCDIVNTSVYSELAGVPIATLAIPFYATIAILALLGLRGRSGARGLLLAGGAVAVAYSGFLFWVSKTELHYVCAWCLRLYGVNAGVLVLSLVGGRPKRPERNLMLIAGGAYVGLLLLSVVGERGYRSTLSAGAPVAGVAADGAKVTHDPKGEAPARSFTVTTEDQNEATYTLDPDDAWTGRRDAKVAVVMFGDFECGFCKRTSAEVGRLQATYGDRVLFVFKHFPMNPACNSGVKTAKHRDACAAAQASVCAQKQGYFWAFHDLAYKNQHELDEPALRAYAVEAGADGALFDACVRSPEPLAMVRADAAVGASLDIHGTPRVFIDGKLYRSGTSAEAMARAVELALGASATDAAKAAAAMKETGGEVAPIPADVPATRALAFGDLRFSIDTFEAAENAVSARHRVPWLRTSWYDAKAACVAAGKRMCTEEEWVSACQGARARDDNGNGELADDMIEGTAYPYGDYHEAGRCWDGKAGDAFRPVYTGELPGCATAGGVYDMTGNVEEWVGDSPERAVLLGGSWDTSEDHARCYRRNDTYGAGYANMRTGFRCCSGP